MEESSKAEMEEKKCQSQDFDLKGSNLLFGLEEERKEEGLADCQGKCQPA